MFSTDKEVHVYIDGHIQNMFSDRKQSLHPEFIDIVLNNAMIEYLSSKFAKSNGFVDAEDAMRRYNEFSKLKANVIGELEYTNDLLGFKAGILIPSDVLKLNSASISYKYGSLQTQDKARYKTTFRFKDSELFTEKNFILTINDFISSVTVTNTLDLTSLLQAIKTVDGLFYFNNLLQDRLRTYKYNFEYETIGDERIYTLYHSSESTNSSVTCNNTKVTISTVVEQIKVGNVEVDKVSKLSVKSSFNEALDSSDHYAKVNSHINPTCSLSKRISFKVEGTYTPKHISLDYFKRPKLFDIRTGQVPEIELTKDFLDYAVRTFYLVLESQAYTAVDAQLKNQ